MLFNSLEFIVFLPICIFVYWQIKSIRWQNIFLLLASYFFYACWDPRFLSLIIASTIIDSFAAQKIHDSQDQKHRKLWLALSLCFNLGMLGFFKYYNFFIPEFSSLMAQIGFHTNLTSLQIILPVGISFYTFQTISYTLDVYYKKIEPSNNLISFFTFVAFFPQLVAGPIERAKNLLPQFNKRRNLTVAQVKNALRTILWGLFKKVALADSCALTVDLIFDNYIGLHPIWTVLALLLLAFQIYGDFSGYSDIAIGTAKLFGFDLVKNFDRPFLAQSIKDFWRRWHISLTSWFKDYVYIPLGGNRKGKLIQVRNILITFTISGLWHGANWTFIFYGLLNGLLFIPSIFWSSDTKSRKPLKSFLLIVLTFSITCCAFVFFRSPSIEQSFDMFYNLFASQQEFSFAQARAILDIRLIVLSLAFIGMTAVAEIFQGERKHVLSLDTHVVIRWGIYYVFIFSILYCWEQERSFIYFQF